MKTIISLLAAAYVLVGTMDYHDAVNQEQAMIDYAEYYSQPECSTDTECGCTDNCLDAVDD